MTEVEFADAIVAKLDLPTCGPVDPDFDPDVYMHLWAAHLDCPGNEALTAQVAAMEDMWCFSRCRDLRSYAEWLRDWRHDLPELSQVPRVERCIIAAHGLYFKVLSGGDVGKGGRIFRTYGIPQPQQTLCAYHTREAAEAAMEQSRRHMWELKRQQQPLTNAQRRAWGIKNRRTALRRPKKTR